MTLTIKDLNGNDLYIKDCVQIILDSNVLHANLADTTYLPMDMKKGALYKITAEGLLSNETVSEFLTRQVNISSWKDSEGVSHEGITNNSIQFRLFA